MWFQGPEKPLFTNDWEGIRNTAIVFGTMLLTIIGAIVKWGQSTDTKRMDVMDKRITDLKQDSDNKIVDVQKDITELGKKLDRLDKDCIERDTEFNGLTSRVDRHDQTLENVMTSIGEFKGQIAALTAQSVNLQRDMTATITESSRQIETSINGLRIEVATMRAAKQERDALTPLFQQMMANIKQGGQGQ
jgi:chromosome segregation ATPase